MITNFRLYEGNKNEAENEAEIYLSDIYTMFKDDPDAIQDYLHELLTGKQVAFYCVNCGYYHNGKVKFVDFDRKSDSDAFTDIEREFGFGFFKRIILDWMVYDQDKGPLPEHFVNYEKPIYVYYKGLVPSGLKQYIISKNSRRFDL